MWNIPLDILESLASSEPVPKSAHYYAGLAWIMMEADRDAYTDRAIELFKKALDLLPGGWVAMEGLARCYGEKRKEYETAIRWMRAAIDNLPENIGVKYMLETRLSDWKLQLGNDEESVGIAKSSYEASRDFDFGKGLANDESTLRSIKHYIEALYRTGRYSEIIEMLRDLEKRKTVDPNISLWTAFLRKQIEDHYAVDIFGKLGKICYESKDHSLQDFMQMSIKKANKLNADTVADRPTIWLARKLAEWQFYYALDPHESIDIWEQIVTLVDQSNENIQQTQNWYRSEAASYLSLICLDTAVASSNSGKDTSGEISKIKDLATHKQGSKRYYRASYPATLLGFWLHEYAKADEEDWRACFQPSVKQALYLLSDDDPWNDQEAYSQLAQALLAAGDVQNGCIAYGITLKPMEDHQRQLKQQETKQDTAPEESHPPSGQEPDKTSSANNIDTTSTETQNLESTQTDDDDDDDDDTPAAEPPPAIDNPKYTGFIYWWECDGPCTTPLSAYTELWSCRVCRDACFCETCIFLHRKDEIPSRICKAEHPLVRTYPLSEDAGLVAERLVRERGLGQLEWLEGVRKMWED